MKTALLIKLGTGALLLALVLSNAWFYQQNRRYSRLNKELILQNDSILSVNLELRDRAALSVSTLPTN